MECVLAGLVWRIESRPIIHPLIYIVSISQASSPTWALANI